MGTAKKIALPFGVFGLSALAAALLASYVPDEGMQRFLLQRERLFLGATLFILAASLISGFAPIARFFKSLDGRTRIALALLLIFSLALRLGIPPRTHRIYFDEDIYLNIAQSMIFTGNAGLGAYGSTEFGEYRCVEETLNKQPNGWPFLVSLVFSITGVNEGAAMILNALLGAGSVLVCFIIGALLHESRRGMWAALVFSLIPVHIQWGATAAAEPSFAFFISLGVACLTLAEKEESTPLLCAGIFALLFGAQIRPEGIVFLLLAAPFYLRSRAPAGSRFILLAAGAIILIPHLTHLMVFRNEDWGAPEGMKFSLASIIPNLQTNGLYFIRGVLFPPALTSLALAGLLARKGRGLLLSSWWLLAFVPYLPFYAGSYEYGADVRFVLPALMPLALLAGHGCAVVSDLAGHIAKNARVGAALVILVLAASFIAHLPGLRALGEESWDARADHDFIIRAAARLPDGAFVFTNNPCVVLLAGKGAVQLSYALDSGFVRGLKAQSPDLYVYRDYWSWLSPHKEEFARLEQTYILRAVRSARMKDRTYTLYRIEKERAAPESIPSDAKREPNKTP